MGEPLKDHEVQAAKKNIRDELGLAQELAKKLPRGREQASILAKIEVLHDEINEAHPTMAPSEIKAVKKGLRDAFVRAGAFTRKLPESFHGDILVEIEEALTMFPAPEPEKTETNVQVPASLLSELEALRAEKKQREVAAEIEKLKAEKKADAAKRGDPA